MRVRNLTREGETSIARKLQQYLGGKGANQAIGVAKLGCECCFLTSLGNDWTGNFLSKKLSEFNILLYSQLSQDLSGQAFIEVDDAGVNKIIIYPGANGDLYEDFLEKNSHIMEQAKIILLQGEIPWRTNLYILETYGDKCPIILDPAPAVSEMLEGIEKASYITPNESEFSILTGKQYNSLEEMIIAASRFQRRIGVKLILKLGENGCAYFSETETFLVSPVSGLKVVDTTGAGDSFNSAFAVALSRGEEIRQAVKFAVVASGISTMREGTSTAMPQSEELAELMKKLSKDQPELVELGNSGKYFGHLQLFHKNR
jgi:ribokinase